MTKKIIIFFSALLVLATSLHYGSPFLIDKLFIIIFACLMLTLIVFSWIRSGMISLPRSRLYLPLLFLSVYVIVRVIILWPSNQRYIFEPLFVLSLIALFLVYLYAGFGGRSDSLDLIKSVLYTNSLLLIAYIVKMLVHFKAGTNSFSGWLVNNNHLAMLAGMLMPYAIALGVYKHQDVKSRAAWFIALFAILAGFLFSVSRGGYISFVLATAIMLVLSAWLGLFSRKTASVLLAACVLAGIFIMNMYPFQKRLFSSLFILSASQRLGIWLGSVRMLVFDPGSFVTGWGIGTYEDAFHRFRPADILYLVNHAHNMFIEIADDAGIIGLGIFLWILLSWILSMVNGIKHASSDFIKAVLWAGLTSTLYLIFHNFVDFGILVPSNAICAIILMAGTASVLKSNGPVNQNDLPPDYVKRLSNTQRVLAGAAAVVLFTGVTVVCSRAIYGEYMYNKGSDFLRQNHARAAVETLTRAQQFINTDLVHYESGRALFRQFVQSGEPGTLDKAIVQFKQAYRLCPWNPYYPEDIGGLYQFKGDMNNAILYTKQSLVLDPTNASLCLRMADMELETGNEHDAISYYKKAGEIYGAYTWNAIAMLIAYNVAMEKIQQTAKTLPDGEWVLANELIKRVNVQGDTGDDITVAEGILKRLMVSDNGQLNRYIPLFISITPSKKNALTQLESLHITSPDMLFYTAMLKIQTDNTASAVADLEHVIQTDKKYKQAYTLLAGIYASGNRLDTAIQVMKQAAYNLPYDYALYAILGAYYNQDNDWYNAIEAFKMAVVLNPKYEQGYAQMALIYKSQDMDAQALEVLKKGMEAVPGNAQLMQMLKQYNQGGFKTQN